MIFGEQTIGSITVVAETLNHPSYALLALIAGDERFNLTRADVERLRDLCDEALS